MNTTKLPSIPVDVALRAVQAEAAAADVELLMPGSGGREAILLGLALVHAISGDGWDLAYARSRLDHATRRVALRPSQGWR
ncbi:MAG: hypothetical protein R3A48_29190 [Polyangiales bacterium]